MIVVQSYKYVIKPNASQKKSIRNLIKISRDIFNLYITDTKQGIIRLSAKEALGVYRNRYAKFRNTDNSALINSLFQAIDSRNNPVYKSCNESIQSYRTAYLDRCKDTAKLKRNNCLYLPFVGDVLINYHRPLPENIRIKYFTIKKEDEKYYAIVTFEMYIPAVDKVLDKNNSIGFDYSSTHFMVDNYGREYDAPRFLRSNLDNISRLRISLSKHDVGSEDYQKIVKKLRNLHGKIARRRKDYLHKLSREIAEKYDYVFVENLNYSQYMKDTNLTKATIDNSFSMFIHMLEYKMKQNNKKIIKISMYYPSSKRCNNCGYINKNLQLSEKLWTCPNCGITLQRDENAAKNIKEEGLKLIENMK